jgi:hypothetical protein
VTAAATPSTGIQKRLRAWRLLAPLGILGLALGSCSDGPQVRDDQGVVVLAGPWSVFDLRTGDCLDPDPALDGEVSEIGVVPCDEPHSQEVFGMVTHPEGPYPGASEVSLWADGACLVELDGEFGLTLDDGLFVSYLLPTFIGWNTNDDRRVVCVLVFPDKGQVTGSVTAQNEAGDS